MSSPNEADQRLIRADVVAYLKRHERKDMLRLLTCGSVDDGKSTLIGRLLYDSKQIYEDQLASLATDSARVGTTEGVDYALLLDGLKAEREQGITIDVAYRFFSTDKRKFIIADTPGHEQYTRNMATGASNADLAILLVDARQGILTQTRRHAFIVSLLGIRHVVLAVNKMDLVDYSEQVFDDICADFRAFVARLDIPDLHFLPLSALAGDNVVEPGDQMRWYRGPTLMHLLETLHIASDRNLVDFRLPVQYVVRPHLDFRGFAGTISSGVVRPGEQILALPSGKTSTVTAIHTFDGDQAQAFAGQAVTLTLADEIDISRGDMLVHPGNVPQMAQDVDAMLVWMHEAPLRAGASYLLKCGTQTLPAVVEALNYRTDVNTLRRDREATTLALNDIGRAHLSLTRPLVFDTYQRTRATGGFVLIDRSSNATVACGMIINRKASPRAMTLIGRTDAAPEDRARSRVGPAERRARLGHGGAVVWLTGLPKAGKTTVSFALEEGLHARGVLAHVLDSRRVRRGLSADLGFSNSDRSENVRRIGAAAAITADAGVVAICACMSPFSADRDAVGRAVGPERFFEVHLAADEATCVARDDEGVYSGPASQRNRRDLVVSFEAPTSPAVRVDGAMSADDAVAAIIAALDARGVLAG